MVICESQQHYLYYALLIVCIGMAALRGGNLAHNPGWYTDETTHVEIARRLLDGEMRPIVNIVRYRVNRAAISPIPVA